MSTPECLKKQIRNYYVATTETSYLGAWSGESLGFHFGIADDDTTTLDESLTNTNAWLAERAHIDAGTYALDAGCGVGGTSIWLARERGARVVGISLVPGQVELARGFAAERGVGTRTSFHCMDFALTTFDEGTFDVVFNIESLCHAAAPESYLAHVKDLLGDHGRFACIDLFRGEGGDPAHQRAMCEGWVLPQLRSRDEVAATLRQLGFVDVESVDLTPRVARSAQQLRAMATNKRFQLRVEKEFTGKVDPLYEAHVLAGLGACDGFESGSVTYGYVGGVRPPRSA